MTGSVVDAYWRDTVLRDDNDNGIPDGIHPDHAQTVQEGGFHPDVGIGIGEIGRQENMQESGLGLGVAVGSSLRVQLQPRCEYHDFDRI